MALPTQNFTHAAEAAALLTEMFRDKQNINSILDALIVEVQKLEDAGWVFLTGRILDNAVGVTLDKWGKIVGQPRNGQADDDYRQSIRLRVRVNNSSGCAEDILQVAILALPAGADIDYEEMYPATWQVTNYDTTAPAVVAALLKEASDAGVKGYFVYSTWSPEDNFVWDSVYGGVAVPKGFGSVYGPTVGGKFVAVIEVV